MRGLIIAIVLMVFHSFFAVSPLEDSWLLSMNFLFWWYLAFSFFEVAKIFLNLSPFLLFFFLVWAGGYGKDGNGTNLGFFFHILLFVVPSLLFFSLVFVLVFLKVFGVYLLSSAVVLNGDEYAWSIWSMLFGVLFLVAGFVFDATINKEDDGK